MEVNVAEEESKFGMKMEEVIPFVEKSVRISSCTGKRSDDDCSICRRPRGKNREYFADLHKLYIDIKKKNHDNDTVSVLSMGMTNDYEVAIEEGSDDGTMWVQESLVPEIMWFNRFLSKKVQNKRMFHSEGA